MNAIRITKCIMKIDQTTVSCVLFGESAQRRMTKKITGIKVKRFSMVRLLALLLLIVWSTGLERPTRKL